MAPIQKIVHLLSIGLIAGARTFHQFRTTVRAALLPAMKVIWVVAPVAVTFAQTFLPEKAWPLFFGFMSFIVNTFANSTIKKKRLAALKRKYFEDDKRG